MSFELFVNIIQDGNFLTHADKTCFTLSVVHNIPTDGKPEKKLNMHYCYKMAKV